MRPFCRGSLHRSGALPFALLFELLFVVSACAGDDPRSATSTVQQEEAEASLAEQTIVYSERGDVPNSLDLYVVNLDGSGRRRLTRGPGVKYDADWSPDGTRIAYRFEPSGDTEGFVPSSIVVMNADGSNPVSVTSRSKFLGAAFSWSPDGERIAFSGAPRSVCSEAGCNPPFGIYVMGADGSNPVRLTAEEWEAQYPAWSPDGTRIAFVSVRGGNFEVNVMNADGTGLRRLTATPEAENWPMWSPDGRRFAFQREGAQALLVVLSANGNGPSAELAIPEDCGVPGNWAPSSLLVLNCPTGMAIIRPDGSGFQKILEERRTAGFAAWKPEPGGSGEAG